jgi:predicted phosphodiesterase
MAKIGLLADAHGNPYGLRACIDALKMRGAESLYFLGDAIGYLPLAEEVLEILRVEGVMCQLGNHEAMLCGMIPLSPEKDQIYQLGVLLERLSPDQIKEISLWPSWRSFATEFSRITLLHGGPTKILTEYVYPDSDLSQFSKYDSEVFFLGNTHIPFVANVGGTRVVNVGSCGLPRDGSTDASCALFDLKTNEIELLRVKFDAEALLSEARLRGKISDSVVRRLRRQT